MLDSPSGADTVLVDETKIKSVRDEQLRYSLSRDEEIHSVIVEPMKFIHICINTGRFVHISPERLGMGGRAPGSRCVFFFSFGVWSMVEAMNYRKRIDYTDDDDQHLCWYMSRVLPDLLDGGRLSLGPYLELERLVCLFL